MLVFVMMLVSTGLMYYYFQRTRLLQRQVMALQSGDQVTAAQPTAPWEFFGFGGTKESPKLAPPATPSQESESNPNQKPTGQNLPPTGAASTPRPQTVPSADDENSTVPVDQAVQEQPQEQIEAPGDLELEPSSMDEPLDAEPEEAEDKPVLDSLYDAPPPVRVRAPERKRR